MRIVWRKEAWDIVGDGRAGWSVVPFVPGWKHWTPANYDHPAKIILMI